MKKKTALFLCALCLFFAVILPVSGCADGKNGADNKGKMNINISEDGAIYNGTQINSYHVEDGKKGNCIC